MSGDERPVSITVTADATYDLSIEECFPDGAPDEWDAQTICDAIVKEGLDGWGLAPSVSVDVDVRLPNPHYTQADALLPDLAPSEWIDSNAVADL